MGWREALPGKYHEVLGEDVGHSLSTRLLQESWGPSPSQGHGAQKGILRNVAMKRRLHAPPEA